MAFPARLRRGPCLAGFQGVDNQCLELGRDAHGTAASTAEVIGTTVVPMPMSMPANPSPVITGP